MDAPFGWRDYLFVAWSVATALAGGWFLAQGVAHPAVDRPRRLWKPLSVFLSPLPIFIFFAGMAGAGLFLPLLGGLGGDSLTAKALASLGGQAVGAATLLALTFFLPGSVQWAPTATTDDREPPAVAEQAGAAEIGAAWRAFNVRTWLQAYLGLIALAVVAALLWKGFYFFCEQNGQKLPEEPQEIVALVAGYDWSGPWSPMLAFALAIVVGAPVAEELTFRGMLYPALKGWLPRGYAVVLTGLLFGLIHGSLSAFLPLAAFGCVLCLFRDRYGLVTCMALHMLFNLLTFVWLCIAPNAATRF